MAIATKAAWRGYINLGQLGIPVRLYTAVRTAHPRFVLLHETDGSPVERELRCRAEGRKIDSSEVVRAIEYEPGKYIPLTDRELAVAAPQSQKSIVVRQFCDIEAIPSLYVSRPFYVVSTKGGERAYSLLREVLVRQRKMAVTQFVMYSREYLAMLIAHGDLLVLQQIHFASEIVPRSSLQTPPLPRPSPQEVDALSMVVERFSGPFYFQDYHDEYSERVHTLIERKAKGLSPVRREYIAPHATPEAEIVTALQNTLGDTKSTTRLVVDSPSRAE